MRTLRLKITKARKYILIASLPTVLLFVLVESAVRVRYYFWAQDTRFLLWGLGERVIVQRGFGTGYELPPDTVVVGAHAPGGVRINPLGLRGKDLKQEPSPDTIRILALGGSSTWGAGNRDGTTWPEQLESKLLHLYPLQKFEVVNGGIPAAGVSEARRLLAQRLKGFRFHIGVMYLGYNDLGGVFHSGVCEWREIPKPVRILNALSNKVLSFLIAREKFSIWAEQGLKGLYDQNRREGYCPPEELESIKKRALESKEEFQRRVAGGLDDYVRNLRDLIEEGRDRDMKFLYVREAHLPYALSPIHQHAKYMSVIWEATDRLLQTLQVPSFDMHSYFQKVRHPEELFQDYPNDGAHLTARGNAVLAEGLIQAFGNFTGFLPSEAGR